VRAFAGRTATFVKARPRSQQLMGGGLALALATAPFGGWEAVRVADEVAPLALDRPVQVGPFEVTVTKVVSVGDLAPSYAPEGARVFAVVAKVRNTTDAPVDAWLLTKAVALPGNARLAKGLERPDEVLDYVDGTQVDPADPVNPKLEQTVVWAWPQLPTWAGGDVTLAFDEVEFYEPGPDDHLSAPEWRETGETAYRGAFHVEPRP
jgi:hypothetical protein